MSKRGGKMAHVRICKTKEVPPGDLKEFNPHKHSILVVNVDGKFHCLSARCTHAGAPLASGIVRGEELQCPWHGNLFRISDGSLIFAGMGPEEPLKVYPCEVKGAYLYVDIPEDKSVSNRK